MNQLTKMLIFKLFENSQKAFGLLKILLQATCGSHVWEPCCTCQQKDWSLPDSMEIRKMYLEPNRTQKSVKDPAEYWEYPTY